MKLTESVMSDIDLLARESKSFDEFVRKFLGNHSDRLTKQNNTKLMSWLKDVWADSQRVLHEASITLNDHQNQYKFIVSHINDKKGFALQFIPDSSTADMYSKNQLATVILSRLKTAAPMLADSIKFDRSNQSAGLVFYIDGKTYSDFISAAMNV